MSQRNVEIERYAIPAKPPKYFGALQHHVTASAATSLADRSKIAFTFDRIKEAWQDFRKARNKQRVKKTPQELELAKQQRLQKQIAKPDFWQGVQNAAQVVPELKRAAAIQQRALCPQVSQDDESEEEEEQQQQSIRTRPIREPDSPQNRELDELNDSLEQSSGADSSSLVENDESQSNSKQSRKDEDSECSDVSSVSFESANKKRKRDANFSTSVATTVDPKQQQKLREQFGKCVSNDSLQTLRARLHQLMVEHQIEQDGDFVHLVDDLFQRLNDVNTALGTAGKIVKKII